MRVQSEFSIIHHFDYDAQKSPIFDNDICIIKFERGFVENEFVKHTQLVSRTPIYGSYCVVSGWGVLAVSVTLVTLPNLLKSRRT